MPEHAELRIMSDFINHHSSGKTFKKIYHVEKGNNAIDSNLIEDFHLFSNSNGKELILKLKNKFTTLDLSVFMGMTGNWKWVETNKWNETKFIRLRIDSTENNSLILYGYYMGPKYKVGGFLSTKRGPDPVKNFKEFRGNIFSNLEKKSFNKFLPETLLDQKFFNGVGAYLTAEILGRLDMNPFLKFNQLSNSQIHELLLEVKNCCEKAYELGGGELLDWDNPFGKSNIDEWIKFYANKTECTKYKFGSRNIWIQKKWINEDF